MEVSYELRPVMYILGQERDGRLGYCMRGGGGWLFTKREALDRYVKHAQLGSDYRVAKTRSWGDVLRIAQFFKEKGAWHLVIDAETDWVHAVPIEWFISEVEEAVQKAS